MNDSIDYAQAAEQAKSAITNEIVKARHEKNISQRELASMSGVKQPIISRMESGVTNPQLDTVQKVLGALGKTLYVGDLQEA